MKNPLQLKSFGECSLNITSSVKASYYYSFILLTDSEIKTLQMCKLKISVSQSCNKDN